MKHSGLFYTLIAAFSLLLFPQPAHAETNVTISGNDSTSQVSVNSETNSTSTTCVNGDCTTSGGENKSTVCINGNCTTSESGKLDIQSEDGSSEIHIDNATSPTSAPTTKPSITPDPTIMQMREDINYTVKQQADAVKDHVQKQENAIQKFFREQVASIQSLFDSLF